MLDLAYGLAILVLSGIGSLAGSWFGSYFKKKGENRATKEDLRALTKIPELVKDEFAKAAAAAQHERNVFLEQMRGEQGLRVLAADRRLQALQEAYGLWHGLLANNDDSDLYERAQRWWVANCLYLDAEPRQAFAKAVTSWRSRHVYSQVARPGFVLRDGNAFEMVKKADAMLREAGDVLVKAAGLPSIAGGEVSQPSKEPGAIWETAIGIPIAQLGSLMGPQRK